MDEAKDYDPQNPTYSHFTQVVWKGSTGLGCVASKCDAGTIFDASFGVSILSPTSARWSDPGHRVGSHIRCVQLQPAWQRRRPIRVRLLFVFYRETNLHEFLSLFI